MLGSRSFRVYFGHGVTFISPPSAPKRRRAEEEEGERDRRISEALNVHVFLSWLVISLRIRHCCGGFLVAVTGRCLNLVTNKKKES